jgi:hypothetical protein
MSVSFSSYHGTRNVSSTGPPNPNRFHEAPDVGELTGGRFSSRPSLVASDPRHHANDRARGRRVELISDVRCVAMGWVLSVGERSLWHLGQPTQLVSLQNAVAAWGRKENSFG